MSIDVFLTEQAGKIQEEAALKVSTGVPDADCIVATGADGKLDISLMPNGVGGNVVVLPASEALAAGDYVNIFDDGGTISVRKADASVVGREADGFVEDAVSAAANATVYVEGVNPNVLGTITEGAPLYLSTTPGQATDTAPQGAGEVVQRLGKVTSGTQAVFEPGQPICKAS